MKRRRKRNRAARASEDAARDKSLRSQGASGISRRRLWLMRLSAATLVPLLLLGVLELGLRVAGYGYPTSYFLRSRIDGQDFLIPNYKFSYRFFPPKLARVPVIFRMAAQKPDGTYRVFLFGESAAYGDPDPAYGVGRYLETLLDERYPSTEFEVICVAMTAINSHAILPIARECARYEGDVWVVYMGNNEMVGPYGAATIFGAKAPRLGLVRTALAVKNMRVGQLMDALVWGLRADASVPEMWGGVGMFSKNPLRYDDAVRLRAYENFKGNLEDILRAGIEADVPILLSTVAINLKDCAPFASLHAADLDPSRLSEWDALYQEGMTLEADGSYAAAVEAYANAAAIDPEFAELQFRLGSCHLALSQREAALQAFERARDHDALAIRADTRINRILMDATKLNNGESVFLVDAAQALAQQSPDGIPGQQSFYEHVHFTLVGNYRLARMMAEQVAEMLPPSLTPASEGWLEAEFCNRRLAASVWDQQRLWQDQLKRNSVPPFNARASHARNVQYCEDQMRSLIARITRETPKEDRQVYEAALAEAPEDNLLRANFAQFLEATGSRSEAIIQAQQVCGLLPDLAWPQYYLGALLIRERRFVEARKSFERALAIRSDFAQARQALQHLQSQVP